MRRLVLVAVAVLVLAGCHRDAKPAPQPTTTAVATTTTAPARCLLPAVYLARGKPSPCLTPGVIRTSDPVVICVRGYATRTRRELSSAQWAARRRQVLARYGLAKNPGEIDHFLPLSGGGANDLENLWPEAAPQFKGKDAAEAGLHAGICKPGVTAAETRRLQIAFLRQWGGTP